MADNTVSLILKELAAIPCEHMVESVTAGETTIALLYEGIPFIITVENRSEYAHTASFSAEYPLKKVDPALYQALNNQRFISLSMGLSVFEHKGLLCFMYKLPDWIRDGDVGPACRQALADLSFALQFWMDITYFQSTGERFKAEERPAAELKERIERRRAFKAAIRSLSPIDVGRDQGQTEPRREPFL